MTERNQATCEHKQSLFLETGEGGGYRVVCGDCWLLGPEREEPTDAVRAFREMQGPPPDGGNTA
jgi:hypothetical protein